MTKALIGEQLHSIAEQEIPDALDLWPAIQELLEPKYTRRRFARKLIIRGIGLIVILMSLMAISIKTIPPVRVFSMKLLQSFSQAISDSLDIEFAVLDPLIMLIADEADFYTKDIEEASSRVGFGVLVPKTIPNGFSLDNILAFEGIPYVSIWYKNSEGFGSIHIKEYPPEIASQFITACQTVETISEGAVDEEGNFHFQGEPEVISISESDDCEDLNSIGKSAEIQEILIGDMMVEYVKGDWVIQRDQGEPQNVQPEETNILNFIWDSEFPLHRFRWENDGLAFAIRARDRHLSLEDYIIIIESMH